MDAAFAAADEDRTDDERLDPPEGTYLEIALRAGSNPEAVLERKRDGIRPGAVVRPEQADELLNDNQTTVALFVPDSARAVLQEIIQEYTSGDLTEKGKVPRKDRVEPIDAVRQARLETFWTDEPNALPREPTMQFGGKLGAFRVRLKKYLPLQRLSAWLLRKRPTG